MALNRPCKCRVVDIEGAHRALEVRVQRIDPVNATRPSLLFFPYAAFVNRVGPGAMSAVAAYGIY